MSNSMHKEVPEPLQGTWRLTDLDISFVSACPQGANPGAKVMLKKENTLMAGKQNVSKEGKADSQVNVNLDTDTLSKSISDNLKKALGDLLAKDKNLSAEAMTEAVVAVVTGDITKMQKDINDQLTAQLADFQKSIDEQIATAKAASQGVDKSAAGEEVLILNGTSFKKSAVGEHAFQAIKASAMQQEQLRKEVEQGRMLARVEKEYPNVAGKPDDKASLLMLIEKADGPVKEIGLSVLKALNDAGANFAKEDGRASADDGGTPMGKMASDNDATAKLDKMAKDLAANDGISVAKAYALVLDTPEGSALYDQHRG